MPTESTLMKAWIELGVKGGDTVTAALDRQKNDADRFVKSINASSSAGIRSLKDLKKEFEQLQKDFGESGLTPEIHARLASHVSDSRHREKIENHFDQLAARERTRQRRAERKITGELPTAKEASEELAQLRDDFERGGVTPDIHSRLREHVHNARRRDKMDAHFDLLTRQEHNRQKFGNGIFSRALNAGLGAESKLAGTAASGIGKALGGVAELGAAMGPLAIAMAPLAVAATAATAAVAAMAAGMSAARVANPLAGEQFDRAVRDTTAALGRAFVPMLRLAAAAVKELGDFFLNAIPDTRELFDSLKPALQLFRKELMRLAPLVKAGLSKLFSAAITVIKVFTFLATAVQLVSEKITWALKKLWLLPGGKSGEKDEYKSSTGLSNFAAPEISNDLVGAKNAFVMEALRVSSIAGKQESKPPTKEGQEKTNTLLETLVGLMGALGFGGAAGKAAARFAR